MSLSTVIVDDEQLARDELAYLLKSADDVTVVAQGKNGLEAVNLIKEHSPDLVFLDVQMPGLDGFGVIKKLLDKKIRLPKIVFATAFDQYAVKAFEVNAVDYLLKPVETARLMTAVERVRRRMAAERGAKGSAPDDLERLLQLVSERQARREQLAIKVEDRFLLVHADEVVHASVENEEVRVVTNSLSGTSNYRTLDELQARLDPAVFWRVHRSHLVNINRIKEIVPWFSRNYILKMRDAKGTEIPVSRSQTRRLREYLKL